jgi:hypothetical protein
MKFPLDTIIDVLQGAQRVVIPHSIFQLVTRGLAAHGFRSIRLGRTQGAHELAASSWAQV